MTTGLLDGTPATSAGAPMRAADSPRVAMLIGCFGLAASGSSSGVARGERFELRRLQQTSSGSLPAPTPAAPATPATPRAIAELRRLSGLTWDELGRLFGVSRRSVHFWASGKRLAAQNEVRVQRVLALIRSLDRGSARANRALLFTALADGTLPFDLLAAGRWEEVATRLGGTVPRARPALPPLSAAARAARKPPPPEDLIGAEHEPVHREPDRMLGSKPLRPPPRASE